MGSIPGLAQRVKDPALPQPQLRSDPSPVNSVFHGAANKEKKK